MLLQFEMQSFNVPNFSKITQQMLSGIRYKYRAFCFQSFCVVFFTAEKILFHNRLKNDFVISRS
jgi:hypothetical protein